MMGDPEECKKVGTYITNNSGVSYAVERVGKAHASGNLTELPAACPKEQIVERTGPLHYGWTHEKSIAETEP